MKSATSSSSSSSLILYSHWFSSCSWRVRFALNLKGLAYEYKSVDLVNGEQYTAEFEQINPLHFVPVLVDNGVVISDSLAILMYLEDKYPQSRLLPLDPHRKAISLQAASIVSSSMQPLHMKAVQMSMEKKIGRDESLLWIQRIIEKGFSALETLLKDFAGKYSMGDEVSMLYLYSSNHKSTKSKWSKSKNWLKRSREYIKAADVFLAPQISIAMSRFHIDMANYPILNRVYKSCENLGEYQSSVPERQPDAKL